MRHDAIHACNDIANCSITRSNGIFIFAIPKKRIIMIHEYATYIQGFSFLLKLKRGALDFPHLFFVLADFLMSSRKSHAYGYSSRAILSLEYLGVFRNIL